MDKATKSIFITGVGGQGILLASELLTSVAMREGYDAKKSEVHGMAQRGGSVISAVKFGEKVYSPLIAQAEADVLLSFEKLEALRYIKYLAPGGKVIVNTQEIFPGPVSAGLMDYPKDIEDKIKEYAEEAIFIDGLSIAKEVGNVRTVNVVLLGATSYFLPFKKETWKEMIEGNVPPKTIEVNLQAFDKGYTTVANYVK
ncbi:indolepyruvate oxidoreductase subunit beta [bacterium]|nr:indolepyruvate oxidoreductase subunit beta [bacterium]